MKNFKSYLFVGLFALTLSQSNTISSMDVEEAAEREASPRSTHSSNSWETMCSKFEADTNTAKKELLTQIDIKVKELAQNVTNAPRLKVIMDELKSPVLNLALLLENDDKMPDQDDESDKEFNQDAALVELTTLTTEMLSTDSIDDAKLPVLMKKLLILVVSISDGEFADDFMGDFMNESKSKRKTKNVGTNKNKQHKSDSSDDDDNDEVDELGDGLGSMQMQDDAQ